MACIALSAPYRAKLSGPILKVMPEHRSIRTNYLIKLRQQQRLRSGHTGRHVAGNRLQRQVAATVFFVWHARFLNLRIKGLLRGKTFVPVTCRMKFSWLEFVRHEAGTKWPQLIFNVASCARLCKLSPLQHIVMPQSVPCAPACGHTIPATYLLCVLSMGLVPASHTCNTYWLPYRNSTLDCACG